MQQAYVLGMLSAGYVRDYGNWLTPVSRGAVNNWTVMAMAQPMRPKLLCKKNFLPRPTSIKKTKAHRQQEIAVFAQLRMSICFFRCWRYPCTKCRASQVSTLGANLQLDISVCLAIGTYFISQNQISNFIWPLKADNFDRISTAQI